MNAKLVLFDIDGTLIYHVGRRSWGKQYEDGLREAYGITQPQDFEKFNGNIERQMAWEVAKQYGIGRKEFLDKFPDYIEAMHQHLERWSQTGQLFDQISDAMELVKRLSGNPGVVLGILTGNAQRIAEWKLEHTGYRPYFSFGLYGEEADDRNQLASLVFHKAYRELGFTPDPSDVIVIGDTVHDIRCGKSIKARTIAVTTGMHGQKDILAAELPDFLVDSLMDQRVVSFLSSS